MIKLPKNSVALLFSILLPFTACGAARNLEPQAPQAPRLRTVIGICFGNETRVTQDSLFWDPNTEPDIAGYRVYSGNASRSYRQPIDVGKRTSFDVSVFQDTTYFKSTTYLAVTAYDLAGNESAYSAEVTVSPLADSSSVVAWPDNKLIRLLIVYSKLDTRGNPITPTVLPEWIQFDDTPPDIWPGEWRPLQLATSDYFMSGDTLILNTLHLATFNTGLRFKWNVRVKLANAGFETPYAVSPVIFQIYSAEPPGKPRPIQEIQLIEN